MSPLTLLVFADPTGRAADVLLRPPPDGGLPGLLVWFHEDGGERTVHRRARGWLARLARDHHLLLVVPQEPDLGYWWAPNAAENSRWTDALLRHVEATTPFDPQRVVFAGMSGGAGFASGLPAWLGWRYGGGVVAACGADIPRENGENDVDDPPPHLTDPPAEPPSFAAWMVVGEHDELRPLSEAAAAWYREQGIQRVQHHLTPRRGHCSFHMPTQIRRGVDAVLAVGGPPP